MTVKTYPEMDAKIVEILRISSDDPSLLYAAQRIEELEQANRVRDECLKIATKVLRHYNRLGLAIPKKALAQINERLAELEPRAEEEAG